MENLWWWMVKMVMTKIVWWWMKKIKDFPMGFHWVNGLGMDLVLWMLECHKQNDISGIWRGRLHGIWPTMVEYFWNIRNISPPFGTFVPERSCDFWWHQLTNHGKDDYSEVGVSEGMSSEMISDDGGEMISDDGGFMMFLGFCYSSVSRPYP